MKNELFDLVMLAQSGDKEAMHEIITTFFPAIQSARRKIRHDRQDDLEQTIMETMIKKIMTYDLTRTPDFSEFCRHLEEVHLRPKESQT